MTIEADGLLVMAVAIIVGGVLLVALARAPQWFVGSLGRHAMWKLRDDIVLDIYRGVLPSDDPAVRELRGRVQWAVTEARSMDLLHTVVWMRARRRIPKETARRLKVPDVKAAACAEQVTAYRERYDVIAIQTALLSSWIGIALVSRYLVPDIVKLLGTRAHHYTLRKVLNIATEEVASETEVGRWVRQTVNDKGPRTETQLA